jgi:L-ribulose-5-phosphate 4-epimerase
MLVDLRHEVWWGNQELGRAGLVTWTSGNVSGRDPESGLMVVKPSGVRYESLTADSLLVVDIDGNVVEGSMKPSVDAESHLYVYRHRPDVNGVVHTHSCYATAFAAVGRPIPVYLTAIADEFGQQIPCGRYAQIGTDDVGRAIVESIGDSPAVLLKNHGVFTVAATPTAAVKAAVMVEDVAKTVYLALSLGQPDEIPKEEVLRAHRRYIERYGQE